MARKRLSKEKRKSQIQKAAKKVILKRGYENTTMEEIISESGMSTGGVYHYYDSVADIFYDIMFEGIKYKEKKSVQDSKKKNAEYYGEFLVDRVLDENKYKSLFSVFLKGIEHHEELREMYIDLEDKNNEMLHAVFKSGDIVDEILEDRFLQILVNSLIIGFENFESIGSKELFKENRQILIEMFNLYLKNKSMK